MDAVSLWLIGHPVAMWAFLVVIWLGTRVAFHYWIMPGGPAFHWDEQVTRTAVFAAIFVLALWWRFRNWRPR